MTDQHHEPPRRGLKNVKVGMVSVYPPSGFKHAKLGGVASYTKNLVLSLLKSCKITLFVDKMLRTDSQYYDENMLVCRCWSKGVTYPFQIFKKLLENDIDIIHVQHEIYLYGGLGSAIVFPLLLFFTRLLRKPVTVTLHGVVPLSKVDGRFLKENRIKGNSLIMKTGLILLMKTIASLSTSIIVHERELKEMLKSRYNCHVSKIYVIHHGIEERNDLVEKEKAKEALGLHGKNVFLFFGYITGYKNVELLIESAIFLKTQDWIIVIAGGSHPRFRDNPNYRRYLSDLREKALAISKDRILFGGFICEDKIPVYFSAADLVILPYKICMHASGPLSLAISYEKPFLVSDSFRNMVVNNEIIFRNNPRDLASKMDRFLMDDEFRLKSLRYSQELKKEHLWSKVSMQTYELYLKSINRETEKRSA